MDACAGELRRAGAGRGDPGKEGRIAGGSQEPAAEWPMGTLLQVVYHDVMTRLSSDMAVIGSDVITSVGRTHTIYTPAYLVL